jgi:DNA-binding beta-propeller fold protein YncE
VALFAGVCVAALVWLTVKRSGVRRQPPLRCCILASALALLFSTGCDHGAAPDDVWLSTGTGPGQVVYPRAISYSAADGTFVVVDRMARVQRFDSNGQFLNDWRMPKWEIGKPVGVSVSPDGEIYVPDTHYHRVQVYSRDGRLLREWGSEGTGDGQFIYPTDVAFDGQGRVFVSEYGDNDRVQVFTRDGQFLYKFGTFGNGDGQMSRPQSMVITNGLVYITDSCNHRLVVYTTDGKFVRAMGGPGAGPGQFRFPYGLDIDRKGRLVVCEFGNNRVQLIDPETGRGLKTWGVAGREPGELAYPWAVAVRKDGEIVVVDSGNNRLQVFTF